MPISRFPRRQKIRSIGATRRLLALIVAALLASPAGAQDRRAPEAQKLKTAGEKTVADKPSETDASRYCVNVAPSVAEARIAWQTKRLSELDAQVKQRITDLEKAEASAREWVAKREALLNAASDELTAIYARMQPESAARQLSIMDDRMAAAILGKLKPFAAGAILDEMEADRASKLAAILSGAGTPEKKS
jgi:flagellar motility protein MotE (MotC chaperone)